MRLLKSETIATAVLETVVIFVGIFAALLADSWWEDRASRARERSYLADLREDHTENSGRLDWAIALGDSIMDAMRLEWADDLRDQHVWVRERVDGILQILDRRTS